MSGSALRISPRAMRTFRKLAQHLVRTLRAYLVDIAATDREKTLRFGDEQAMQGDDMRLKN